MIGAHLTIGTSDGAAGAMQPTAEAFDLALDGQVQNGLNLYLPLKSPAQMPALGEAIDALKKQRITCYYTNMSGATLNQVTIYLEGVGDPGIVPVAQTYVFPEIRAGASVRVSWLADFEHGGPLNPELLRACCGAERLQSDQSHNL